MKSIHFLVHWDTRSNQYNLTRDGLISLGFAVNTIDNPYFNSKDYTLKHRILIRWLKYFVLGIRAIRLTKPHETIICSSFTAGISLTFLNKLLHCKRKIILTNLIARKKGGLNAWLRKVVYHYILDQPDLIVTLNSLKLIEPLKKEFNIRRDIFEFMADSTSFLVVDEKPFSIGNNYIFAGGDSSRDWETLIAAAVKLPEIKFVIVASRKSFKYNGDLPVNIEIHLDINANEFYGLIYKSSIVVLPISEDVPAGLIVIVNSAFLHKPVIATKTSSIENYIRHNETGLLYTMRDASDLAEKIKLLNLNVELQALLAKNLKSHITNNFSDSETAKTIENFYIKLNPNVKH